MNTIKTIHAYEIIDSRGYPTLEGKLVLSNGSFVTTSVPSGMLPGKYGAIELRDNDPKRFNAMGVSRAVYFINALLAPKIIGTSPDKQQEIDYWLIKADGTNNKSILGANTTLLISQLLAKAAAFDSGIPLFQYINHLFEKCHKEKITIEKVPTPIFNIINGGKHANSSLEFQEFEIISSSSVSFSKAYEQAVQIFFNLKRVLQYRNANVSLGDQGGFTPNFASNLDALEILNETILQLDLKLGLDIFLGIDVAASHFFKDDRYYLKDHARTMKPEEFLDLIISLTKSYSILAVEDALQNDDWQGWKKLNAALSDHIYVVGDDLTATNKDRLITAIREHACNSIVIKPSQSGTITETLEVVDIARKNNINYILSHRSGETCDTFVADFAVGVQSEFVKFGAPSRGERVSKYNRLWTIERDELKKK